MFAEDQCQVDLRELVVLFVLSVLDLLQALGVTGDGTDIVGKILLVQSPFSLQSEEVMPAFICYGLKQFRASLTLTSSTKSDFLIPKYSANN